MNFQNLIRLTAVALMTGQLDASAYQVNPATYDVAPGAVAAGLNVKNLKAVVNHFKNQHEWPQGGVLNTSVGFSSARDLFDGVTQQGIISFGHGLYAEGKVALVKKIGMKDLERIAGQFRQGAGFVAGASLDSTANTMIAWTLRFANPKYWPKGIHAELAKVFLSFPLQGTVSQLKKANPAFIKEHPKHFAKALVSNKSEVLLDSKILKELLRHEKAIAEINKDAFMKIAKNPNVSKLITGKVFSKLQRSVLNSKRCGKLVRFLPKDVFSHLEEYLAHEYYQFATPEQIANFQSKTIKDKKSRMKLMYLSAKQTAAVSQKVWKKTFKRIATKHARGGAGNAYVTTWRFWKYVPAKIFKELANDYDLGKILPPDAFKAMTKEQRQMLLNVGDKDKTTTCSNLPVTILKGKARRVTGLTASKKCFEDRKTDGRFIFRALLLNMFNPALGRRLGYDAVHEFKVQLKRPATKGKDGKIKKHDKLELAGVLAMEALRGTPNGPDFVKAFFNNKEKDEVVRVCAEVSVSDLKKTKWIQTVMSKHCVKSITDLNDLDEAKKLHPNIWINMSKEQIKELIVRSEFKNLEGPFMEGLAGNRHFAAMSCKQKTKENRKGDDVPRKSVLSMIKASQRSEYFGAKYLEALPDNDKECMETVIKNASTLSPDLMTMASASFVAKHPTLVDSLTSVQRGRISDDLDANTYPATLTVGKVMAMKNDDVANLSDKFISHMTESGIGGFTADQVKLIQPESLTLLCGSKAAALKHELSEAQKASLGKNCPASAGSMAPTNAHIGAFTAVAALAAGSMALLI